MLKRLFNQLFSKNKSNLITLDKALKIKKDLVEILIKKQIEFTELPVDTEPKEDITLLVNSKFTELTNLQDDLKIVGEAILKANCLNGINSLIKEREKVVKLKDNLVKFMENNTDKSFIIRTFKYRQKIKEYKLIIEEIDENLKKLNKNTVIRVKLSTVKLT
jgi:hypothetical protein